MTYLPEGLPLPNTEEWDHKEWWEACQRRELVVQQCTNCGTYRHPPGPGCYHCQSFDFKWTPMSGRGTVYSYIIAHHPGHAALKDHGPYNVVLVELADTNTVRMLGNLIDVPNDQIKIGMHVHVTWEERGGVVFPQWVKAK